MKRKAVATLVAGALLGAPVAFMTATQAQAAGETYTMQKVIDTIPGGVSFIASDGTPGGDITPLMGMYDDQGNLVAQVWCAEAFVITEPGTSGYHPVTADSQVRNWPAVNGIMKQSIPLRDLSTLQSAVAGITTEEAAAGTQLAIWHITDNIVPKPGDAVNDGIEGSPADLRVEALYNYLLENNKPVNEGGVAFWDGTHQTLIAATVEDSVTPEEPTPTPTPTPTVPVPTTPAPTPTQSTPVPTPTKPAPTKPAPKPQPMVTRTFQVDYYQWRNSAWFGNKITSLDDDGLLTWNKKVNHAEDYYIWKSKAARKYVSNRWEKVTVTLPANATREQWMAGINRATKIPGNDVSTFAKKSSKNARTGFEVVAWEIKPNSWFLGRDMRKNNAPQVFFASR